MSSTINIPTGHCAFDWVAAHFEISASIDKESLAHEQAPRVKYVESEYGIGGLHMLSANLTEKFLTDNPVIEEDTWWDLLGKFIETELNMVIEGEKL